MGFSPWVRFVWLRIGSSKFTGTNLLLILTYIQVTTPYVQYKGALICLMATNSAYWHSIWINLERTLEYHGPRKVQNLISKESYDKMKKKVGYGIQSACATVADGTWINQGPVCLGCPLFNTINFLHCVKVILEICLLTSIGKLANGKENKTKSGST